MWGVDNMFLLPIGTSAKLRRFPIVTLFLIGVNTLVYLLELVAYFAGGEEVLKRLFYGLGFVPASPRVYSLITSIFVHDAPMPFHIIGNMLYLWIFGKHIENALGSIIYGLFYITSQLGAIFMQVTAFKLFNPDALSIPQVGASGSIAALLGLFAVRFYHERIELFYACGSSVGVRCGTVELPSILVLGIWFALEILNGVLSQIGIRDMMIGHWAHVGGFIVGVIAAFSFGSIKDAQVESLISHAERSLECGTTHAALKYLKRASKIDPANVHVRLLLAALFLKVGEPNLAREQLQRALCDMHSAPELSLLEVLSSLPERLCDGLLQISTPDMKLDIAILLERAHDYDGAIRVFEDIASDDGADCELRALAMLRCASLLLKHGCDKERAVGMFKQLCELFPSSQWVPLARHMLQRLT